ncbi:MAG: hypothetical protein ACRD0K_07290 [Egibacteraceae bacterium]
MSANAGQGPPSGFWIALPAGWVSLDVDPATSAASARKLVEAAARGDETVRANRAAVERTLVGLTSGAAASGVSLCACYYEAFEDQLAVQASLTVAIHALDQANDPAAMVGDLASGETSRCVEVVDLGAGPVVRRAGRRGQALPGTDESLEFVVRQYYVPVPGTSDRVALLSFASPALVVEDDLVALFDSMAGSFVFTWGERPMRGGG